MGVARATLLGVARATLQISAENGARVGPATCAMLAPPILRVLPREHRYGVSLVASVRTDYYTLG